MKSSLDYLAEVRRRVLDWGAVSLRDLPWRQTRDPWAVLVAERMLQQTQVSRVQERFSAMMERFGDPEAMAASAVGEVVSQWAGLGYNSRAVQLHRSAVAIVDRHGGRVPCDLDELLALPGVGPYTARAVRAFAFELDAAVVDTNVGRVLARLSGASLGAREAQALADALADGAPPWLWNQSILELGALVCVKRSPRCDDCPVNACCRWRGVGADPAPGSAGVSGRQSRFAGSDRELRGRVVGLLRGHDVAVDALADAIDCHDDARLATIVAGLQRDGLVVQRDGVISLP